RGGAAAQPRNGFRATTVDPGHRARTRGEIGPGNPVSDARRRGAKTGCPDREPPGTRTERQETLNPGWFRALTPNPETQSTQRFCVFRSALLCVLSGDWCPILG